MFRADPTQVRESGTCARSDAPVTAREALAAYERLAWAADAVGPQQAFEAAEDVRRVVRFARQGAISPVWVDILDDERAPEVVRQRALGRVAIRLGALAHCA